MAAMNLEQARSNMITQQIRPWDVADIRVLELMMHTPREEFVPAEYRSLAYYDMALPIGHGQFMMPPRLEARLLQALAIQPHESVLEVGTGSGFLTALLAQLAGQVHSVEIIPELKAGAEQNLASRGLDNITLEEGDAAMGWPVHGQYDVIVLTGSLPELSPALQKSLKTGGRLFAVIGQAPVMEATLVTRKGETEWQREILFETELPPLLNVPQPSRFVL